MKSIIYLLVTAATAGVVKQRMLIESLIGVAVLFFSATPAHAAVFNIANGDVAGLKSAITTANSNSQDDTINLAPGGTYTLTTVDNTGFGATGLPVIGDDFDGTNTHSLTINGNGATIARSSSGGTPDFRILTLYQPNGGSSSVTLNGLTIANGNAVGSGISATGGGILTSVMLIVQNCTLSGNHASDVGGAIYSGGSADVLTVSNSTISNNSGGEGSIFNFGTLTVSNSTFANGNGTGDIHGNGNGHIVVTDCTFSGSAYGIFVENGAVATLGGTILKSNGFNLSTLGSSTITSQGYNLSSDNGHGFLTNTGDQINTDPKLDPAGLQDNGGPTKTIAPTIGSPAIDKGKSFGLTTDQRGQPRPGAEENPPIPAAPGGDGSDIGAVEMDPLQSGTTFVVTTTDDHDDGRCGVGDCTLREAINAANAAAGPNTITFAPNVTGTITLSGVLGALNIADSTTITGPGARLLAVSGNGATTLFDVGAGTNTISGLTIRDGMLTGSAAVFTVGGGIFNSATLTLNDCALSGNQARGGDNSSSGGSGGVAAGGAIGNTGILTLNRCTFTGNSVTGGNGAPGGGFNSGGNGGGGLGGGVYNHMGATLAINNCTFNNNTAVGGNGGSAPTRPGGAGGNTSGAVFNLGTMTVTAATISGNTGSGGAGGTGTHHLNGAPGVGTGGLAASGGNSAVGDIISAGNTGNNGGGLDVSGTFTSSGYNFIGSGDHSNGFSNGANHDQVGTDAMRIIAQLGPLQNNGGPTDTMALLSNSPAINAGDPNAPPQDQRYYLRNGTPDIGAFEFGGTIGPMSAVSQKTHGSAGPFNVTLPLTGPVGIECRSGGATNDHQLIVTFPSAVTVNGTPQAQVTTGMGQVGSGGTSNGGVVSVNGAVVTVPLTNVVNQQRIAITLASVSDGINTNNVSIPIGVLLGDTTGDGFVNSADISQTKSKSGQSVDGSNFREDVNADGFLNSADISLVKSKSGSGLP